MKARTALIGSRHPVQGEHYVDDIQTVKEVGAELLGDHSLEQLVTGPGDDARVERQVGSMVPPLRGAALEDAGQL